MNSRRGCGLLPWLLAALSLLLFRPGVVLAADSPDQQMSLTLNAGESYVIDNVSPGESAQRERDRQSARAGGWAAMTSSCW